MSGMFAVEHFNAISEDTLPVVATKASESLYPSINACPTTLSRAIMPSYVLTYTYYLEAYLEFTSSGFITVVRRME